MSASGLTLRALLLGDLLPYARSGGKRDELLMVIRTCVRRIEHATADADREWLDAHVTPSPEFPVELSVKREYDRRDSTESFLLPCDDGVWDCDDGERVARYRLIETGTVEVTKKLRDIVPAAPQQEAER